ncbi:hypothetical protein SEA_BIRTHDAYBOY_52 [Gordonia phage BirthdayBoy]|uniref:DUF5710 domain-containing protein n=3 Tax=Lambovirus TaxID=2843412 RepID=A0A9E7QRE1_9CAUD|nr:hypothetical protein SEA_PARVUSTARDA_49 [Gordonia phage ParvusTarda]WNM65988.1 hypothetical protein SEA_BIRTHDAYBOY_52 [Gordonia phage BirthdayBoy]WNO26272.1 hypothetical protein SEA_GOATIFICATION_50 [Gordonia phage GOATification]WNO27164.1 hypothetical protein SEA_FULCRUM_50 [Gordonia phage Fulcrum]
MAIKCGNCKQYHDTVDDVKACHFGDGLLADVEEENNAIEAHQLGMAYAHEVAEDPWAAEPEARRVNPYGINAVQESGEGFLTGRKAQKVYLNVPFVEKDRAKTEFGAKWDSKEKKWWVYDDADFDSMPDKWYLASGSDSALADRHAASANSRPFNTINEDGFYRVKDEFVGVLEAEFIKVQMNREGSRLYAKRLNKNYPEKLELEPNPKNAISLWCTQNGMGRPIEWEFISGLYSNTGAHMVEKLSLEEGEAFGRLYGVCMKCGAFLTNEESIERGMGPICAGKWN